MKDTPVQETWKRPIEFDMKFVLLLYFSLVSSCASLRIAYIEHQAENQPPCGMEDYASGTWVRFDRNTKNYVCCNWDRDQGHGGNQYCQDGMHMRGIENRDFHILNNPLPTFSGDGAPFKYISSGGHSCGCDNQPSTPDRILDFENYQWQPSTCRLEAFDANRFCSMLGNRRVLNVGDSTAVQTSASLMNMIRAGSLDGKGCSPNVQYTLTDSFDISDERNRNVQWNKLDDVYNTNNSAFNHVVSYAIQSSTEEDVVILSSGPHFHSEEQYRQMLNFVKMEIERKRNRDGNRIFLWKTINGGGCGPLGTTDGLQERKAKEFQWDKFPAYDAMAAAVMQSISPSVPVINVSMLYQRGDAHPGAFKKEFDCLHFCSPGPLDETVPIISHVLSKVLQNH